MMMISVQVREKTTEEKEAEEAAAEAEDEAQANLEFSFLYLYLCILYLLQVFARTMCFYWNQIHHINGKCTASIKVCKLMKGSAFRPHFTQKVSFSQT